MLPPISGVVSRFSPSSVAASVRTTALSSSDELPNAGRRVAGRKAGVGARSGILPFGPRSSVDRATDFESVCGGSIPPGAARLLGRRLLSAGRDRPTEPPDAAGCTPLAARRSTGPCRSTVPSGGAQSAAPEQARAILVVQRFRPARETLFAAKSL